MKSCKKGSLLNRRAAVAGGFYPKDAALLAREIERCFEIGYGRPERSEEYKGPLGVVSPHAGYTYSGVVQSFSYGYAKRRKVPETVIIVGPNHTGYGSGVSIWPDGEWETPLGNLKIDSQLAEVLLERFPEFTPEAHRYEHSIEAQLPFVRYVFGEVKIVPICVLDQSLDTMRSLGELLRKAIQEKNVLLVASSDFTHYEPEDAVNRKDMELIRKILELDAEGAYATAEEKGINACGLGPILAVMYALKDVPLLKAKLLKHATSADATGDRSSVVGYASIAFDVE